MDWSHTKKKLQKALPYLLASSAVVGLAYDVVVNQVLSVESFLVSLLLAIPFVLLVGTTNILLDRFLSKRFAWSSSNYSRIAYSIVWALLVNTVVVLIVSYVHFIVIKNSSIENFFAGRMALSHWFLINTSLVFSALIQVFAYKKQLIKNYEQSVVEQEFIATTASTQVQSLKNQLDPHFLFNSLNVLTSLIQEDQAAAQRFTQSMSKVYRYVIEQNSKELATVAEEIEFAKLYSKMLQTRFDDSVQFEFPQSVPENGYIVPLSLQLVLENCIKHNRATSEEPLIVRIEISGNTLSVRNNIQRKSQEQMGTGIGLQNIIKRYNLLTDREVLISDDSRYFSVVIPILTQKQNVMTHNTSPLTEYEKAYKRVEELKGFYGNLISYCIFIPFLFFVNWKTSTAYWWAFWPMLGWGIGVVSHAFKVFGIGREWEEKQIRKYMEKNGETKENWK